MLITPARRCSASLGAPDWLAVGSRLAEQTELVATVGPCDRQCAGTGGLGDCGLTTSSDQIVGVHRRELTGQNGARLGGESSSGGFGGRIALPAALRLLELPFAGAQRGCLTWVCCRAATGLPVRPGASSRWAKLTGQKVLATVGRDTSALAGRIQGL